MAEDPAILKSGVEWSIGNWEKVLKATQEQFPQAAQRPWNGLPFNRDGWAPNIQNWLTKARDAVKSLDPAALSEAREAARHAWRPASTVVRTAVQSAGTSSFQAPLAFGSTPAQPMPIIETFARVGRSTLQVARANVVPVVRQVTQAVRQNPATVPLAVAAGEAAVAGGARGLLGGWVGVAVGATVAVALAVGVWAWTNSGSSSSAPQDVSAGPSPAPVREPEPVPSPVENLLGPGGSTDPGGNDPLPPTPNAEPLPVPAQDPGSQSPQQPAAPAPSPQPQPAPPPAPPPTPECQYPSSIGVSGGDTSSLGPQGGSFTVTSPNVTLSTGGLVNCGQHYQLGYSSSSGGSGYDCKTSGFSYGIGSNVQVGDSVSVNFNLPPNSCG